MYLISIDCNGDRYHITKELLDEIRDYSSVMKNFIEANLYLGEDFFNKFERLTGVNLPLRYNRNGANCE